MKVPADSPVIPRSTTLISAFVIIAALYFAREVFIPLALAALLSFLLAPMVIRLRRWGIGRIPAVAVTVGVSFVVIGFLTALVATQLIDLANDLPNYQRNIVNKIRSVSGPSEGIFSQPAQMLRDLSKELATRLTPTPEPDAPKPVPVEISEPSRSSLAMIRNVLGSLVSPLVTAGVVIIFVIFMLIQREDLRDRLIRLIGPGQINVATQALDDAASRVSRYLLMQLVVNATYGLPVGIGLYFIGIPNPLLWGLFATLLRFVPYVGPTVAAVMPILVAFAIDPGWTKPLLTILLFITLELISNNFMEPWLYGSSTGISATAILVAAVFWTWLWGPSGLLLSTPLTVCLVVLGRYVPQLQFLHVLLADAPVLTEEARFYQRLLAMNDEEANEIAEEFLRTRPLLEFYDRVIIPALSLAEQDRHHGALDEVRQAFIIQNTRNLIDELADHVDAIPNASKNHGPGTPPNRVLSPEAANHSEVAQPVVICLPARDEADELGAVMLSQLLVQRGIKAVAISAAPTAADRTESVAGLHPQLVCISAVPPSAVTHARSLARRLRQRFPELRMIVGIWNREADPNELRGRFAAAQPDAIATTLADAVQQIATQLDRVSERGERKSRLEDFEGTQFETAGPRPEAA